MLHDDCLTLTLISASASDSSPRPTLRLITQAHTQAHHSGPKSGSSLITHYSVSALASSLATHFILSFHLITPPPRHVMRHILNIIINSSSIFSITVPCGTVVHLHMCSLLLPLVLPLPCSGGTTEHPGLLQYACGMNARIRPVQVSRALLGTGPAASQDKQDGGAESMWAILGGRPLVALAFEDMTVSCPRGQGNSFDAAVLSAVRCFYSLPI